MSSLRRLLARVPRDNPWSDGASALILVFGIGWWHVRHLGYYPPSYLILASIAGLLNPLFIVTFGAAAMFSFFTYGKPRSLLPPLLVLLLLPVPFGFLGFPDGLEYAKQWEEMATAEGR